MKEKRHDNISESQVEEALVLNLAYLQELLELERELRVVARQMWLRDGERRIDLLIASGHELHLVELKITPFLSENLEQILDYKDELTTLQAGGLLVPGKINAHLLVTKSNHYQIDSCAQADVHLLTYKPVDVLERYFRILAASAPFLRIKPNDYGVYNLGLMNRTLAALASGATRTRDVEAQVPLHRGSIKNHLRVSREFGLVRERKGVFHLTDLGDRYSQAIQPGALIDQLSPPQIRILKEFIAKDPFYSSTVFGVYAIVESASFLSRNAYPIALDDLRKMFQTISGKTMEWRAKKSLATATYTFLNFATDLELLGKLGKQIVITPAGFQFILMLQLHKSIEMIESLSVNQSPVVDQGVIQT